MSASSCSNLTDVNLYPFRFVIIWLRNPNPSISASPLKAYFFMFLKQLVNMDSSAIFELVPFYLFSLVFPLLLILWQVAGKNKSKFDWIARFVFSASSFIWIYFLISWAGINYYLRYLFPMMFLIASIYSFQKVWMIRLKTKPQINAKKLPWFKKLGIQYYFYYVCLLIMSVLFLLTAITCFMAQFYPVGAVQLEFPLKGGAIFFCGGRK